MGRGLEALVHITKERAEAADHRVGEGADHHSVLQSQAALRRAPEGVGERDEGTQGCQFQSRCPREHARGNGIQQIGCDRDNHQQGGQGQRTEGSPDRTARNRRHRRAVQDRLPAERRYDRYGNVRSERELPCQNESGGRQHGANQHRHQPKPP